MNSKNLLTIIFLSVTWLSSIQAADNVCNIKLVNNVANCVSAKSTFLTSRNLTYAGMALSSAGGVVGVTQLRKNFADYLVSNREELIKLGAKQGQVDWAEDWRKDAAGPRKSEAEKEIARLKELLSEGKKVVGWPGEGKNRYPPRLKEVSGVIYDIANIADTDIDRLPGKFHSDNIKSAQVAIDEAIEQLKQGKPLDHKWKMKTGSKVHDAWLANNSWAKNHPVQGKSFEEMVKMSESDPDLKLRAEAKANVTLDLRRIEGISIGLSQHARNKGAVGMARLALGRAAASNMAKISAAALGSVIGAGLFALEIGGDTPFDPSSCLSSNAQLPKGKSDTIPGQKMRVRDIINVSFDRGCYQKKPEFSADDRVLRFLILSDEEKEAALKVPEVCEFYKGLQESTCSAAKLDTKSATCDYESGKFTIYLIGRGTKRLKVHATFDAIGNIKAITGPNLNGYSYDKADSSWAAYSVPISARRGTDLPQTVWVRYDNKSMMAGAQKKIFDRFEETDGWDIAANFGAIESFVNTCANPKKSAPIQHLKDQETVQ